ncbi:hypothetical protein QJ857_gp1200 [Tupanvirus soda lake]|uniref:Virion-associated membrane protein n=2 Tax=Tupanvirus TaxID=2094720 RepID=A0A6N1NJ07_9VIRU|nr:hypothetical protein QJ857_gp1200 [Tupanvirus soda lake]QKU34855.1 hypothetical protein [Tupanvirus soda lake]
MTTVKFGDTVFLSMPLVGKGMLVTGVQPFSFPGLDFRIPKVSSGDITHADPYVLDPVNNRIGETITTGSLFKIRRFHDPKGGVWGNYHHTDFIPIQPSNDSGSHWQAIPVDGGSGPITYGEQFRLLDKGPGDNPRYDNGTLNVHSRDNGEGSIFTFLPGPLDNAKLECCKNNPALTLPDYCGVFRGPLCNGYCDDILTNYCAKVTTSDPKCGCLLPESYYKDSKLIGPAECVDDRCVNQNTYRRKSQCNPTCNIINCIIDVDNAKDWHVNEIIYDQKCGNTRPPAVPSGPGIVPTPGPIPTPTPPSSYDPMNIFSNKLLWFGVGIFVVIILFIIILFATRKKQ